MLVLLVLSRVVFGKSLAPGGRERTAPHGLSVLRAFVIAHLRHITTTTITSLRDRLLLLLAPQCLFTSLIQNSTCFLLNEVILVHHRLSSTLAHTRLVA